MHVEGHFEYNKPVIVDADLLNALEKIVSKFYDRINYSVELKNGDNLKYDTIEEVLEYDNFDDKSIVNMTIWFGFSNYIGFLPAKPSAYLYSKCVSVKYDLDDMDTSEEFKRKILIELKKHTQSNIYVFFNRISFARLNTLVICLLSIEMTTKYLMLGDFKLSYIGFSDIVGLAIWILIWTLLMHFYPRISMYFFPSVIYKIGEGIKKAERMSKIRSFWGGIIVSTIIAIIIAMFF